MAKEDADDLFDDVLDDDGSDSGSAAEGDALQDGKSASDGSSDPKDKRINDLMSRAQKAEAEAAKLRNQLAKGKDSAGDDKESDFEAYMRESVRRTIFAESGLSVFGLEPNVIEGATVAEMQASAKRQKDLIEKMRTTVRGEVLTEHGLSPDAAGGVPDKPIDYAGMSDEEFQKVVDRSLGH